MNSWDTWTIFSNSWTTEIDSNLRLSDLFLRKFVKYSLYALCTRLRHSDLYSFFSLLYSYHILVWLFLHEKVFVGVTLGHTVLLPCSTRTTEMVRFGISAHTSIYFTADSYLWLIYWLLRISLITRLLISNQLPIDSSKSNSRSNHFGRSCRTWK